MVEVNSTHNFKSVIIHIIKYFVLFNKSLSILQEISYNLG